MGVIHNITPSILGTIQGAIQCTWLTEEPRWSKGSNKSFFLIFHEASSVMQS